MRICFVAVAGSIHTQKWVDYFAQRGHEVHIISFSIGGKYSASVRLYQLPTLLPQVWAVSRYINWWLWFRQVRRLVSKIKPDVIDAHYVTPYGYLAIASGFHPVVLTAWGSDILVAPKQSRWYRLLTKYSLKKAEIVICDSEMMQKELLGLGAIPSQIRVIYNGIDTQEFRPQRGQGVRLGIPEKVPVVISTRNLRPVYNVAMLVRAIPLVLEQEPQARFIIIGDGEQREHLDSLASSLGVADNVRFLGWVAHDELPAYLAASDIYVSTSLSDSTSLSLQEAMACELAPVVTDLPANREWVNDGENGFIVPQDNPKALAERIICLIRDKETRERFGKEGRKIIRERAEYEVEMSKMEKIYQEQVVKGIG
ncbi:MAG: glycosyltransferase family 4 protein [Chloroflexi bacterium]|nr:glycosyltransferase family 4 protein [Chloroflexota bacterium]